MASVIVYLGAQPGWNPLQSAGDASAFSALMAAIVVSITVQIAFGQARTSKADESEVGGLGLAAAPFSVALLLLATYLYIILAGMDNPPEGPSVGAAIMAGSVFAIAGTVFALGGLSVLFTLACVIHDNKGSRVAKEWSRAVFSFAIFVIALFLIFGYELSFRILDAVQPATRPGPLWWLGASTALLGPIVLGTLWRRRHERNESPSLPTKPSLTSWVVVAVGLLAPILAQVRSRRHGSRARHSKTSAPQSRAEAVMPGLSSEGPRLAKARGPVINRRLLAAMIFGLVLPAVASMALVARGPDAVWCDTFLWASTLCASLYYSLGAAIMVHHLPRLS